MDPKQLRFHWRLPYSRELPGVTSNWLEKAAMEDGQPDMETLTQFCRQAEEHGIDSVLTDFGHAKPDPMLIAVMLGQVTSRLKFLLAYRSGLFAPTIFVQQLNTLSALVQGRVSLNIVAGFSPEEQRSYGDFLPHDDRYRRTEEFLAICRAFWRRDGAVNYTGQYYHVEKGSLKATFLAPDRTFPEILIGGGSPQARDLACTQGTCWMRLADVPARMKESVASVRDQGVEVGVRLGVIARRTRQEALDVAAAMSSDVDSARDFVKASVSKMDSVSFKASYEMGESDWLTPALWVGATRIYGPAAITLVGSSTEVAEALMEYKALGISQFILSGWPKFDEMLMFGETVLPIVRELEAQEAARGLQRRS